jgi:hypothetical protein
MMSSAPPTTQPVVAVSKPWYTSKIIWAQAISVLLMLLAYLADESVLTGLGLPPQSINWVKLIIVFLNALTIYFRFQTPSIIDGPAVGKATVAAEKADRANARAEFESQKGLRPPP